MSDTSDWARRVDQMTGATVHEQLRTVVRDAEAMLLNFTTSAYESGGLLLDAQREMEASVERKLEQLAARMDEMGARLAAMEEAQQAFQSRMVDLITSAFAERRTPPVIAAAS